MLIHSDWDVITIMEYIRFVIDNTRCFFEDLYWGIRVWLYNIDSSNSPIGDTEVKSWVVAGAIMKHLLQELLENLEEIVVCGS